VRLFRILGVLIAGGIVVAVWSQIRSESERIGDCAREAAALSRVSEFVRETLYPDTDHFLGTKPRLQEEEHLRSLENAFARAKAAASRCRTFFYRSSALQAREIFLAAQEQRNLAATPHGNWISYMAETAKARTQFELAHARYELDRPASISNDGPDDVNKAVQTALLPVTEEQVRLRVKLADEEKEAERVKAIRKADREAATLRERGPARDVLAADFEWSWHELDSRSSIRVTGFGREVGTSRAYLLSFKNVTPWRMYWVSVALQGRMEKTDRTQFGPGESDQLRIEVNAFTTKPPAPTFSGTFTTALLPTASSRPSSLSELIGSTERFEEEMERMNKSLRTSAGAAATWTLTQAREQRSRIGQVRDQAINELKRWPARPDAGEPTKHMKRAIALAENACDYLDSIIARLKGRP
jgi:hypothetical protein